MDVSNQSRSLLLLIPAYNEERRLEPVLRDFAEHFQKHYSGPFQLVVVLNGCTDDTIGVVRRVAQEYKTISALDFPGRIGKGGALIEGLKLAPLADLIGYVDADGATSPTAFLDLVNRAHEADCVIASRWLPGAIWVMPVPNAIEHADPGGAGPVTRTVAGVCAGRGNLPDCVVSLFGGRRAAGRA